MALLLQGACFGTGVSGDKPGTQAGFEDLSVSDITLVPPAPAVRTLVWSNSNLSALQIDAIEVDEAAKLSWQTSLCPSFPSLMPQSSCALGVTARAEATPGAYMATVRYSQQGVAHAVHFGITIEPGALVINDGAPIALSATSSAVPISVRNDGFNVADLKLRVACPDAGADAGTCVLDANDCAHGLKANATCTALLVSEAASAGAQGAISAGGPGTGSASCNAAVRVGSVEVQNLTVTTPGTHALILKNYGAQRMSVQQVVIAGAQARDVYVTGLGAKPSLCQNFSGTCSLPLVVGVDAALPGGVAAVTVTYTDGDTTFVAGGALTLKNLTQVRVDAPSALSLPSSTGTTLLAATNLGPFTWHGADLAFVPNLAGVSLTTTCASDIPPGDVYTATAHVTPAIVEGATASLQAVGHNLAAPSAEPIAVGPSLLAVGTDAQANGNAVIAVSYDGGISWASRPQGLVLATWKGALLDDDVWTVVGRQTDYQCTYTSSDRGQTWLSSTMPQGQGILHSIAGSHNFYVAVGAYEGLPLYRISTDNGATWGAEQMLNPFGFYGGPPAMGPGPAYAVARSDFAWVIAGGDGTNYWLMVSTDNAATWSVGKTGAGTLNGLAWDGHNWLAVGHDGAGQTLVLVNEQQTADAAAWRVPPGYAPVPGTLRAVHSNINQWLMVGDDGANRIAQLSLSLIGPTFYAPENLGPGSAYGVAYRDGFWQVAAIDSSLGQGVIDTSDDGQTFKSAPMPFAALLSGVFTRPR